MDQQLECPNCTRQLTGAVEVTSVHEGKFVFIVQRETTDCNWTKCTGCKTVICKSCRSERPTYCCSEGRIIDHERARLRLRLINTQKSGNEQEETLCRRTTPTGSST